jgi:hypothetical protein
MKRDLRNDKAKARDAFLESEEGLRLCEGTAIGEYLRNRIELAWCEGWEAAKADTEKKEPKVRKVAWV